MPDFKINPYIQPYVGGANKEFGETLNQKLTDYHVAADNYDTLGYQTDTLLQNTANFQGDQLLARDIMNKYRGEIAQAAEMGDYENMGREVKRSARNFAAEVAPLVENKKRVAAYQEGLQKQFESGDIKLDTYQKTLQHSLGNYQGLDRNDPQGTMFKGFVPSKDYNVAEGVNKFLDTFKADKTKTFSVPTKNGLYVTTDFETVGKLLKNGTVTYDNMAEAAANYLAANSDFQSYRDTQVRIGNQPKVLDELNKAVKAGIEAQGYTVRGYEQHSIPVANLKYQDDLNAAQMPTIVETAPGTYNPQAVDQIGDKGLQRSADGVIRMNPNLSFENGQYYMYTDPKGKPIDKATYDYKSAYYNNTGTHNPYTKKGISIAETEKYKEDANKHILIMSKNNLLRDEINEAAASKNPYRIAKVNAMLNNPEELEQFLEQNRSAWDNSTKRNIAATEYQEAIKNSAEFVPQVANFNKIKGGVSDVMTAQEFLAVAAGKSVAVMSTKGKENFRDSERKDIESLIEEQQGTKGEFMGATPIGLLNMNPYNEGKPGIQYQMRFKKDGVISTANVIVPTNDPSIQPIQDINQMLFQGVSGEAPFVVKNPKYNPSLPTSNNNYPTLSGKLRLNTFTDKDRTGKAKFNGFVEVLDVDGNKVNNPSIPNNMPVEDLMNIWMNVFVPDATNQYLTKPQEKAQLQE
jgi:hypothetical protein